MASWVEKSCQNLLKKLNGIPQGSEREQQQLALLMSGFADINKEMMRRAAENARAQFGQTSDAAEKETSKGSVSQSEQSATKASASKQGDSSDNKAAKDLDDTPDLDDFDAFDEELDMIEQTLIRSIGD
ncbi:hypothetical protein [Pleionea mediterranea]|jgi:hypothetical protein|uniref:Uncharacterized protein n=1 Tax=Pleionea mediterranea TaxID=523701 RepID=A0A316G0X1_9GAMM|nr:hypothetical protein [Pleionea mediterranea]PWK54005.1 hypothetical protein C8D97_102397 [Pleionea mediterranea]